MSRRRKNPPADSSPDSTAPDGQRPTVDSTADEESGPAAAATVTTTAAVCAANALSPAAEASPSELRPILSPNIHAISNTRTTFAR
ncbi:hypothetical protein quinque_000124 [Culex quinquefasciatus]